MAKGPYPHLIQVFNKPTEYGHEILSGHILAYNDCQLVDAGCYGAPHFPL